MWPWKSFCLISPQLSSWKAPTQIESVAAKCQGAQPGSLSPEGSEGPGGALGPYPTPQKPEHLPDCRRLLPFCSLSSGHSASAQGGTHSSPMTLPTPPPGRRAPLRTPPPPAEPRPGDGNESGGASVQVGAASRGWNQTGAEGPQGGRATWVRGGRPLASQCDEGLSTGGADHVLRARTSTVSLCLKSSILGTPRWYMEKNPPASAGNPGLSPNSGQLGPCAAATKVCLT